MPLRYRILAALWLFHAVNYVDRVALAFAGPAITHVLSLDPAQFGAVLSAFAAGYCLAQTPGGLLADRLGVRPMLVVCPVVWGLLTGGVALAGTLGALLALRFAFGLAEGASNGSIYKALGDHFAPEERSRASGIATTSIALAPALAGPLIGYALGATDWRTLFLFIAVPAFLTAALNAWVLPRAKPTAETRAEPTPLGAMLRLPSLWIIALAYVGYNVAFWGYLGWMPTYLRDARHLDLKAVGLLGGAPYLAGAVGLVLCGMLGRRIGLRRQPLLLALTYLCGGAALWTVFQANTLPAAIAASGASAFFLYGGLGVFGAIVLQAAPEGGRAAFSGLVSTMGQLGGVGAPLIIGLLVKSSGSFASAFAMMALALIVAAASAVWLFARGGLRPSAALA